MCKNFLYAVITLTLNISSILFFVYIYNSIRDMRVNRRSNDGMQQCKKIVISKFLKLYSKAKCTSLFMSTATNQRVFSKRGSREAQVRFPEYQEGTEQCFGFNKLHFTFNFNSLALSNYCFFCC